MENTASSAHATVGNCSTTVSSKDSVSSEYKSSIYQIPEQAEVQGDDRENPLGFSLDLEDMLKGLSLQEEKRSSPNTSWQNDKDLPDRRKMVYKIAGVLLKSMRIKGQLPDNLPRMATSFEAHLFVTAPTRAEYLNDKTLKRRVRGIVRSLQQLNSAKSRLAAGTG
mmetsp:Transcript_20858/g.23389  ORF Transcript_20858/g.23389 Transcript_20858/m.23389 type:complete len:166 (-) Transcript_20858:289-786(-)